MTGVFCLSLFNWLTDLWAQKINILKNQEIFKFRFFESIKSLIIYITVWILHQNLCPGLKSSTSLYFEQTLKKIKKKKDWSHCGSLWRTSSEPAASAQLTAAWKKWPTSVIASALCYPLGGAVKLSYPTEQKSNTDFDFAQEWISVKLNRF